MKSISAIILLVAATVVAADNSSPATRHSSPAPSGAAAAEWDADPVAWRLRGETFASANAGRALAPSPKGRRVTIRPFPCRPGARAFSCPAT